MSNLIGDTGMGARGPQEQMALNINPADLEKVACECGNEIFEEGIKFFRLSALLSPTGKEEYVPRPTVLCKKCGSELSAFADKF